MPSASVNGSRNPISTTPAGSAAASSALGLATRTTTAASASRLGWSTSATPLSAYWSSGKPARTPAPRSTTTSKPDDASFAAASGVSATRFSPGADSRGTHTRISPESTGRVPTPRREPDVPWSDSPPSRPPWRSATPTSARTPPGSARTRRPWRSGSAGTRGRSRRSGSARPFTTSARSTSARRCWRSPAASTTASWPRFAPTRSRACG